MAPTERGEPDWLEEELAETLDEDVEVELEDAVISLKIREIYEERHRSEMPRPEYFRSLLQLQAELIKLQDWVVHTGEKVVVLFEGRDAAGKGGVIKRITQRLNPRVVRTVAPPRPRTARRRSGTSSATCRICPRPERSSSSTAAGTTARAWSVSWASPLTGRSRTSSTTFPSSSGCWCAPA